MQLYIKYLGFNIPSVFLVNFNFEINKDNSFSNAKVVFDHLFTSDYFGLTGVSLDEDTVNQHLDSYKRWALNAICNNLPDKNNFPLNISNNKINWAKMIENKFVENKTFIDGLEKVKEDTYRLVLPSKIGF